LLIILLSGTDREDYNLITLYAQYAAASYCDANRITPDPKITCGAGNCPQVQLAGATAVAKLGGLEYDTSPRYILIKYAGLIHLSSPIYRTGGFVAVDPLNQLVVVSIEGTDDRIGNAVGNTNSAGQQVPISYCTGCAGARGYVEAFQEIRDKVVHSVQGALKAHPGFQVVTTGHSLGGAVATFAALELRSLGIPVHAVGFPLPTSPPRRRDENSSIV
jgi:hypothetical protein